MKLSTLIQKKIASFNNVHNLYGALTIRNDNMNNSSNAIDIVFLIDAHLVKNECNSVFNVMHELPHHNRASLIVYSDEALTLTTLKYVNEETCNGLAYQCTNFGVSRNFTEKSNYMNGIAAAVNVLNSRKRDEENNRISAIFLVSDNRNKLDNMNDMKAVLKNMNLPDNCLVFCFDIGDNKDGNLLNISNCSGGKYFNINSMNNIEDCIKNVADILSCDMFKLNIKMKAFDGARIVQILSFAPIEEKTNGKNYNIKIGNLKRTITILFKLSLRKMDKLMDEHRLIEFKVGYVSPISGKKDKVSTSISIPRRDYNMNGDVQAIDNLLLFSEVAQTISTVENLANNCNLTEARKNIENCVKSIKEKCKSMLILERLEHDLQNWKRNLIDVSTFHNNINDLKRSSFDYYNLDVEVVGY